MGLFDRIKKKKFGYTVYCTKCGFPNNVTGKSEAQFIVCEICKTESLVKGYSDQCKECGKIIANEPAEYDRQIQCPECNSVNIVLNFETKMKERVNEYQKQKLLTELYEAIKNAEEGKIGKGRFEGMPPEATFEYVRNPENAIVTRFLKRSIECGNCGKRIFFIGENERQTIECPYCSNLNFDVL
tara:strand:+ start:145 stop:699 length:555 start_codon:yes stop_codon:yes gene_type:complete